VAKAAAHDIAIRIEPDMTTVSFPWWLPHLKIDCVRALY
jgi:hypothetical protein